MKKALQVLKNRPKIIFSVTRDSVCAGDDCDAPHQKSMEVTSFTDPEVLARELSAGYLPPVAGIGHTWDCLVNGKQIATIGCYRIDSLVREVALGENNEVHFRYHSATY